MTTVVIVDDHPIVRAGMRAIPEAGAEAFIPKDDLELELVKKWLEKADSETDEAPNEIRM